MFNIGELFAKKQQVVEPTKKLGMRKGAKLERSSQLSACKELLVLAQLIRLHGYNRSTSHKLKSMYEKVFKKINSGTFVKRCRDARELIRWLDENELEIVKK